jgi:hypothetical protein
MHNEAHPHVFQPRRFDNTAIRAAVQDWVASIGLDPAKFSTHSLRRTKPLEVGFWDLPQGERHPGAI